ncbi:CPXCG motif-containing cysteine-rich protein [Thiohalorhabdus methylotrophus]|uniref:CPXCG motif-containing cysteine-rich protein n=1 Tax=Thiohalorhabdus methylotrophus TaxID=3242694 RepID=A0ABV4TYT2_9GAMM
MDEEPLPEIPVSCPYCGEGFATLVDTSGRDAAYIEDCPVCCAPIEFTVSWPPDGGPPEVVVARDDD